MTHMYFSALQRAAYRTAILAAQILVFIIIIIINTQTLRFNGRFSR